ncbi:MAG: SPOR domain-containing protein [Methylobacter sp.]
MAKDYKHRVHSKNNARRYDSDRRSMWRWMLITALIILFVVFLTYLFSGSEPDQAPAPQEAAAPAPAEQAKVEAPKQEKAPEPGPVLPQFDFYTILPEKEVVIPDYEINTRAREERVGQAKAANYILQAGSFKDFKDADNLRAKLAMMGIESKVEKAKVGNTIWNRVKMGPYTQMASVTTIRTRLRENGIDAVVMEVGH